MEITWMIIMDLINSIWDVKQINIANCLNIDRSTISRLISGEKTRFSKTPYEIYENVFDPKNPKSLAHSQKTKELLNALKQEIKKKELADAIKGLPSDDYENFVLGLLKLAKKNEPKSSAQKKISSHNATDKKIENIPKIIETPSVSMIDVFFKDYDIKEFIDINPLDSLPSFRIRDAIDFIGRIKLKHEGKSSSDENEDVYKKIILFADILEKYLKFLAINSSNPICFTKWNYINFPKYEPTDCNIDILRKEFDIYLRRLRKIYKSIEEEHKRKLKEYEKEWRARREAADNVETGSLSNAIIHHLNSNQNSGI